MNMEDIISCAKAQGKVEECDKVVKLWDRKSGTDIMVEKMCHVITIHA